MNAPWKLAVAVRGDLEDWQRLNVAAFVTSGMGTAHPDLIGEPYIDASGQTYPPIAGLPIRVFSGDAPGIKRAFERGLRRDVTLSIYTDEMFSTMNDAANRSAVAEVETADLSVAGFAVAGPSKEVDKVFDKLRPHQ